MARLQALLVCALASSAASLVARRALPAASRVQARRVAVRACAPPADDLNSLTTRLNDAIALEDYAAAAGLRDRIASCAGAGSLDGWTALGAPEWLAERAERLGYRVPTPVQRRAFASLGAADTVIRSQTGSGKTLSYLMPVLSALSDDLLEEDMTSYLRTFLGESGLPREEAKLSRGDRDRKQSGPLAVIVVATRELGVQVAMLAYQLCGGNRNPAIQPFAHPRRFEPGSATNMYKYGGPRHVQIAGVWDADSLNASMPVGDYGLDALKEAHIVVGTPECLAAVARRGHTPLHAARFAIVDEADACMRVRAAAEPDGGAGAAAERGRALGELLRPRQAESAQRRVLVGASVSPDQVAAAAADNWIDASPTLIVEGGIVEGGIDGWRASARQRVPSGLAHRYVRVGPSDALGALVRMIRAELLDYETHEQRARAGGDGGDGGGAPRPRPRIIVFCKDAETAVEVAAPLQSTLWSGLGGDIDAGLCGLSVLLPSAEDQLEMGDDESTARVQESSLRILEMFSIESTNLLITTVGATRGLDFPGVTHVFNLGCTGEPDDYLHRAGRAGRIGHRVRGVVTSIVDERGVDELRALGAELGFEPSEAQVPLQAEFAQVGEGSSQDEQVRYLEDVLQLYSRNPQMGDDGEAAASSRGAA